MATTRQEIPVRVVPREQIIKERQEQLHVFEMRYEMSSERMATLVELDAINLTSEVIRWYHVYYAVKSYQEGTHTTGTPGTITGQSMKSA